MNITRFRKVLWLGPVAAAVLFVGCSADRRRGLGEEDTRDALTTHVEQAMDAQGTQLAGDLDCRAEISDTSAVTASCSGVDASGAAVAGSFEGTANVDAESCTAHLVVSIANRAVVDEPQVDCFDVE